MDDRFQIPDPAALSICKCPVPAPPLSCYNHAETVTIRVKDATATKDFVIFRKLLEYHSSYFAAALDPTSGLGIGDGALLEVECDIAVFELFHCWLYTRKLKEAQTTDCMKDVYPSPLKLYQLWVFADFRGITELKNKTIDVLHEYCVAGWTISAPNTKYVYANTIPGSALRQILILWIVQTTSLESFQAEQYRKYHTIDLLHDVLPKLACRKPEDKKNRAQMTMVDRCQWHDHSGPGGKLRLEGREPLSRPTSGGKSGE